MLQETDHLVSVPCAHTDGARRARTVSRRPERRPPYGATHHPADRCAASRGREAERQRRGTRRPGAARRTMPLGGRSADAPPPALPDLAWNILLASRHEGFGGTITTLATAREPDIKAMPGVGGLVLPYSAVWRTAKSGGFWRVGLRVPYPPPIATSHPTRRLFMLTGGYRAISGPSVIVSNSSLAVVGTTQANTPATTTVGPTGGSVGMSTWCVRASASNGGKVGRRLRGRAVQPQGKALDGRA
jgi:hypothetical protein